MKTIWKYPLRIRDWVRLEMPRGAEILCVQVQGLTPCLWALVDDAAPKVGRRLRLYGTVHECDAEMTVADYVGTFQVEGGAFVFHVFDEGEE